MKHVRYLRITGLCLVVIVSVSAIASASASAELPTLYECAKAAKVGKKYTGKFTDKKCTKEATAKEIEEGKTNKYEFQEWNKEPKKIKAFKGKGGRADLAIEHSVTVACAKSTDSGKFTGPKTAGDVVAIFTGCEIAGLKCSNTSKAGEIKTNPLDGEVGYINKTKKEVGADLKPESGLYFAEFQCEEAIPLRLRVGGSVIGRINPINTMTKEATFEFRESGGKQEVQKFETGLSDILIAETCKGTGCTPSDPENAAEETIAVNKGEELELVA
jgi:hypothetical protein